MSVTQDGRSILCDGDDCDAIVSYPVVMTGNPHLSGDTPTPGNIRGWLFVTGTDHLRHYCPQCSRKHLDTSPDEEMP